MKPEDINKENIFKVPDRYFDELPGRIQARIPGNTAATKPLFTWKLATAIVVPAMMIMFFLIYNGTPENVASQVDVESMISQVEVEDVISYLELTNISTDDIMEQVAFSDNNLGLDEEFPLQLEELDIDEEEFEAIVDQYDINI